MEKVKIAVIGLGDMGIIHANAYMNNPNVELVAVCDNNVTSLNRFINGPWNWKNWWSKNIEYNCYLQPKYPIKHIYNDYTKVVNNSEIDAVSICIPDVYHTPVAIALLKSNKHLLIEKPMAPTTIECKKILSVLRNPRIKLLVGHMWRFHPEVNFIKKAVSTGILGKIVKTKGYAIYIRSAPTGWFLDKKYAVRGALMNMGVHAVDTLRYVLGDQKALKVYAKAKTVYGTYDVDDLGVMIIEFKNGTISIIETGQNHPYADGLEASTQLFGTKGYARIFPTEIHYKIADQWGIFKPDFHISHISPFMYQEEIDHFINCILYDSDPIIDGESAMENVRIIEAAYQSSDVGELIQLD